MDVICKIQLLHYKAYIEIHKIELTIKYKNDVINMNEKLISIAIILLMILGSFGAVGTTIVTEKEPENDCECSNSEDNISNMNTPVNYQCGLVIPENWRVDAHFDPCTAGTLPSEFDWRNELYCGLPVCKNQGECGSCWAFAVVGALEWNIMIKQNKYIKLSEQWLVSCNQKGWGCNGGWLEAHKYHLHPSDSKSWKDPCGDSGAVLDNNYIYTSGGGEKGACKCNSKLEHDYYIDKWSYIGSYQEGLNDESIKQAIMEYGPISAAVCVGPSFLDYDGGVFRTDESKFCLSDANHAVVLVGWKDEGLSGHWILRNSWGRDWGEDGYMRIKYGTSNIGYGACYVKYTPDGLYSPGKIDFGTVRPHSTHHDSFTLINGGSSTCKWCIKKDSPSSVGVWTFTPSSGQIASNRQQEINVELKIGGEGDGEHDGLIWIYNEDDSSDNTFMPTRVIITTGKRTPRSIMFKFLENFPILQRLLKL